MASILTSCSTCSCSCSSSSQIRTYFYHLRSDAVSCCSILRRNHDYLIRGSSGLSQPISLKAVCRGCFVKRKRKGVTVQASLFGVGAPEALVIGVVALLVFGPKGLAEVARTLGKSLRSFQPTIRELQEVSREFKNTLEQEIGLDELRSNALDPYKASNQTMRREPLRDQNGQMGTVFPVQDGLKSSEQIQNIVSEETLKTPIVSETSELNDRFSSTINSQSETTQTLSSNASELPASQIKMEDDKPK